MNRFAPIAVLVSLLGCGEDTALATSALLTTAVTPTVTPVGPALPLDHPPVTVPPTGRSVRRFSVDQLAASLPVIAGNDENGKPITWTVTGNNGKSLAALGPDALARTLGQPDYYQTTHENLEPSSLYVKLMDDMARDVCGKMVVADQKRPAGTPRVLTRDASLTDTSDSEAVRRNVRTLALRFWGQSLPEKDTAATDGLVRVFDAGVASATNAASKAAEGWRAVCVAMLTSPEFHLY